MSAFKAFFFSRLLREKVLLVAFVAIGLVLWGSAFLKRATRQWQVHRALMVELADQKQWLNNQASIEAAAAAAVKNLDPSRTLDETRLVGEVSALAREHNLKGMANDTPQTERSGQFAVHTMLVTIPRAEWSSVKNFYTALAARSPYIGVEQLSLTSDRANPSQLNAVVRVTSVEIVR
jgi:hypothetical protein